MSIADWTGLDGGGQAVGVFAADLSAAQIATLTAAPDSVVIFVRTYQFNAGTDGWVQVSDANGGTISADAVRFVKK